MSTQERLLTPLDLAKRWNGVVSLRTIYSWTQKPHRGPKRFSAKGEPVAYRPEDIEAFERTSLRLQLAMAKRAAQ
jgi:hypothetical protein